MGLPAVAPDGTWVVTGASSGIGAEIARELARRGRGVTLVARREDRLRTLADELADKHDIRAEVVAADLTAPEDRARIHDTLAELDLTVHGLVNNAGLGTFGSVQKSQPDAEVVMIRTNVEAVADLCSRFIPGMAERGAGAVLNVASTAAFQPMPGQAGYAATKSFVVSYGQAIRAELRGTGVSVTTLCPGPVHTEFGAGADIDMDETPMPKFMWLSAEKVARAGVHGMERGKAMVIPGLANKAGAIGGYLTPRRILAPIIARQHPALRNRSAV